MGRRGLAAAFALVTTEIDLVGGTFSQAWLVAGIGVYAAAFGMAIVLALAKPDPIEVKEVPVRAAPGEPQLLERTVTYRTKDGMAVRLTYLWPDGSREVRHVAFTPGESLALHDIGAYVDAFPRPEGPRDNAADVDAMLAQRARKGIPVQTEKVTR